MASVTGGGSLVVRCQAMRTLGYFLLFIAVVAIFSIALVVASTFWYEIGSMLD